MNVCITLLIFLHFSTEICGKPITKEDVNILFNKIETREDWIKLANYYVTNHKPYNVKKYMPYRPLNKTTTTKAPAKWLWTTEGPITTEVSVTASDSETTTETVTTAASMTSADSATTTLPVTTTDLVESGTFSNDMAWESTTSVPSKAETTSYTPNFETSTQDSFTEILTITTELSTPNLETTTSSKETVVESTEANQYISTTEANDTEIGTTISVLERDPNTTPAPELSTDMTTEMSNQLESTTAVIDVTTQDYDGEIRTATTPTQFYQETTTEKPYITTTSYDNASESPDKADGSFGLISSTKVPETSTGIEDTTQIQESTTQTSSTTTEISETETTATINMNTSLNTTENSNETTEKPVEQANLIDDNLQAAPIKYSYSSDIMPESYWF